MVLSGGIIPLRKENDKWKVLILRCYTHWDFPKGKKEAGETLLQAAIREAYEEADLSDLKFPWGCGGQSTDPYSRPKKIATYFMATTNQVKIKLPINPDLGRPENHEGRWVSLKEARKLLSNRLIPILDWAEKKLS